MLPLLGKKEIIQVHAITCTICRIPFCCKAAACPHSTEGTGYCTVLKGQHVLSHAWGLVEEAMLRLSQWEPPQLSSILGTMTCSHSRPVTMLPLGLQGGLACWAARQERTSGAFWLLLWFLTLGTLRPWPCSRQKFNKQQQNANAKQNASYSHSEHKQRAP